MTTMNKIGQKILLAAALQLIILNSFAIKRAYTVNTGTDVILRASIFDPFDVFRGDYINLKYDDISSLPKSMQFKYGREVYAVLMKNNPYWQLKGIYCDKPELTDSEVIIKGKIEYDSIKYGIERFYIPEGHGKIFSKSKNLVVDIAVDKSGSAIVKSVEPEQK
jgi:uncharacterized membrane-anchored protein